MYLDSFWEKNMEVYLFVLVSVCLRVCLFVSRSVQIRMRNYLVLPGVLQEERTQHFFL